jgi:hypothetical protein
MGLGSARCGVGLVGLDAPVQSPEQALASPPLAPLYNIATRTFPASTGGLLLGVHPVDQKVALALGVLAGRLTCAPAQGTNYSSLSRLPADQIQTAATNIVNANPVIKALVRNKDITILAIRTAVFAPGNNQIGVDYMNNHTKQKVTANG